MLELYQFQHSATCFKVRLALKAKELAFRTIDITPGVDQINIFKISGQRQVPVLKDEATVLSDSTAIIEYLETIVKEPSLFPSDPIEAATAHMIEDWADTTLAKSIQSELIKATAIDPLLREALLPQELPHPLKGLVNNLSCEFLNGVNEIFNPRESNKLLSSLEKLSNSVSRHQWLVGNSLSIADIAISAQLSLLKFPISSGKVLYGKGCPGFSDNPKLKSLFNWRDKIESFILETDPAIL